MELNKSDTKILKGMAILLMVLLHLFARKDVNGLYDTFPLIGEVPLVYYIALLGDACRPIYMFVTGYAFYIMVNKSQGTVLQKNVKRIFKLYINFWIVFLIFVPLGFLFGSKQVYTFDAATLLLDFFGLSNSFNGAWWFMQVYVIFVLLSPLIVAVIKRFHYIPIILISGVLYFVCHLQRYKSIIDFGSHGLTEYFVNLTVLMGTSLLSFVAGAYFAKEKFYTRIHQRFSGIRFKNTICLLSIASLIVFHGFVQSSIIAPINGILFICLFMLLNKNKFVQKSLDFISNHSTNIWLTHMFFYETIFTKLTFAPKYPILIFIWLIVLCLIASYIIKAIVNPIIRLLERKPLAAAYKSTSVENAS